LKEILVGGGSCEGIHGQLHKLGERQSFLRDPQVNGDRGHKIYKKHHGQHPDEKVADA
jgi:hypothetical protein